MSTKIEWCDATINPVVGCSHCSPGCDNCYAERFAARLAKNPKTMAKYQGVVDEHGSWTGKINSLSYDDDRDMPHRVPGKSKRVFVGSMTDLFHPNADMECLDTIFASILFDHIVTNGHGHSYIVLTKRADRMLDYFSPGPEAMLRRWGNAGNGWLHVGDGDETFSEYAEGQTIPQPEHEMFPNLRHEFLWPLPNVWLGVTVCNQAEADEKIPLLLQTPAAKRFVSVEPMLGPVEIGKYLYGSYECGLSCGTRLPCTDPPDRRCAKCGFVGPDDYETWGDGDCEECPQCHQDGCCGAIEEICPNCGHYMVQYHPDTPVLDWLICGGETGPGARPMHPDWVRSLRDQCQSAGTPYFFKSWGEWTANYTYDQAISTPGAYVDDTPFARVGKRRAGRLLDGREWNEFLEVK